MHKVILFDLGGVLFTNGTKKFIEDLSKTHNISSEKVREVMEGEIGSRYREGKMTRDEFWKVAREELGLTEDADTLETEWINGYELIEGTRDLILELSKKYKVYFISDNVRERVERIEKKYGFRKWFEDGIFSHEVGIRKPNPKIYELIIQKVNVKPEEIVFIDDKPVCLAPAAQLGMTTFLFENPDLLRQKLASIGVL